MTNSNEIHNLNENVSDHDFLLEQLYQLDLNSTSDKIIIHAAALDKVNEILPLVAAIEVGHTKYNFKNPYGLDSPSDYISTVFSYIRGNFILQTSMRLSDKKKAFEEVNISYDVHQQFKGILEELEYVFGAIDFSPWNQMCTTLDILNDDSFSFVFECLLSASLNYLGHMQQQRNKNNPSVCYERFVSPTMVSNLSTATDVQLPVNTLVSAITRRVPSKHGGYFSIAENITKYKLLHLARYIDVTDDADLIIEIEKHTNYSILNIVYQNRLLYFSSLNANEVQQLELELDGYEDLIVKKTFHQQDRTTSVPRQKTAFELAMEKAQLEKKKK